MASIRRHVRVALCVGAMAFASSCCGSPALGTLCSAPPGGDDGVSIVSPALECRSRLCLVTRRDGVATGVCTVECASDSDCASLDAVYCRNGYTCARVGLPQSVCVCVQ